MPTDERVRRENSESCTAPVRYGSTFSSNALQSACANPLPKPGRWMTTMTKTDNKLRIKLILTGLWGLLLLSGCLIDQIGGAFSNPPEDLERNASQATRELIDSAYYSIFLSPICLPRACCLKPHAFLVTPSHTPPGAVYARSPLNLSAHSSRLRSACRPSAFRRSHPRPCGTRHRPSLWHGPLT
jgi:hypothetical protein